MLKDYKKKRGRATKKGDRTVHTLDKRKEASNDTRELQ